MSECAHTWQLTMAMDGCHHFNNTYACTLCGVAMSVGGERQMLNRGRYTASIMMSNEECERCRALLMGARRRPGTRHILDPKQGSSWVKVRLHP